MVASAPGTSGLLSYRHKSQALARGDSYVSGPPASLPMDLSTQWGSGHVTSGSHTGTLPEQMLFCQVSSGSHKASQEQAGPLG